MHMCAEETNPTNEEMAKQQIRIRKYLSLENVSILAGAGTSWHLGPPTIRSIPADLKEGCKKEIKRYFPDDNADPSYEDLFNCLQADRFLKQRKQTGLLRIDNSIHKMQDWLFMHCDTEKTEFPPTLDAEIKNDLLSDRYFYHEMLIKKLLQRPANLKRINLFTTNYDMAFDYALDNLGIQYINGFTGIHKRYFRPEVYDYDLYYPGQSVSGKVYRAEKVLKYYKLHGSLSWISTEHTSQDPYGIQELDMGAQWATSTSGNELMVYPCANKKTFTLDLPYSELFRQFAQAIIQPQSVLFCLGYSFNDEHINDIIHQALAIPSFTLIVANYSPSSEENTPYDKDSFLARLRSLRGHDKRIILLPEGDEEQSSFCGFVKNVLPDLYEEEEKEYIQQTMSRLGLDTPSSENDGNPGERADE